MTGSDSILVTGGAGFLGSHLVADLVDDGHDVTVVDDFSTGEPEYVPYEATVAEVDVRSDALYDVVWDVSPTVVYHLAAIHYVPYCDDYPEEAFDVNVMGTRNLLDALRGTESLETLVNASSAAVYPPVEGPVAETRRPDPMDVYGKTKLVGEDLVELFGRERDVRAVSARLFNIYGPQETNPHLIPAIVEQLHDGDHTVELGNLTPRRDFVHVRDAARALRAIADAEDAEYRAFNVGTGDAYSVREVVERASTVLGTDVRVEQDEDRVRESDRPHLQADVSRLLTETDWRPSVAFETGLSELLRQERVVG